MANKFYLLMIVLLAFYFGNITVLVSADVITGCTEINSGGIYILSSDIIESENPANPTYCLYINANDVILDCNNYKILGRGNVSYGIFISKPASTDSNIEIKNCIVSNWTTSDIYMRNSNKNTLENLTLTSSSNGLYLYSSDSNTISNVHINSNSNYGIFLSSSNSNMIRESLISENNRGIHILSSSLNTILNSRFENNIYGIYIQNSGALGSNNFFNNFFNNTNNFIFQDTLYENKWNTTRQQGVRIYSTGVEIGGNYWSNPLGEGYSDSCTDSDTDGFCDSPYTLATSNIDYLPLSNKYDSVPPSTSIYPGGSSWTNSNINFSLVCDDSGGSGCNASYYKIINDSDSCGTSGYVSGNAGSVICHDDSICKKKVCYYSVDMAGNEESTKKSNVFYIDTKIPSTTIFPDGYVCSKFDIDFFLLCQDEGSGCSSIYYKITNETDSCDLGNYIKGNNGTITTPDGSESRKVVCYFSTDMGGNKETVKRSKTFFINKNSTCPPVTEINYTKTISNEDIPFTLTCINNEVGCNTTYYKVINSTDNCPSPVSSLYLTGNSGLVQCSDYCKKKICYYSVDHQGNEEPVQKSEELQIDKIPPSSILNSPPLYQNIYSAPNFILTWQSSDIGSGIKENSLVWSYVENLPIDQWPSSNSFCLVENNTANCTITNGRQYFFKIKAIDNAGNVNTSNTISLIIDSSPPISNFYSFENKTDHLLVNFGAQDNLAVEKLNIQYKVNNLWINASNLCNINVTCSGQICSGYAECPLNLSSNVWRVRAYDMVGNRGNWVYTANMICKDKDNDGFCVENGDCNDSNPNIYPGAPELCNGIDDDCDGYIDEDFKVPGKMLNDTCGTGACEGVYICSADGEDVICSNSLKPGDQPEICSNGIDDDCDGLIDEVTDIVNGTAILGCVCKNGDKRPCGSNIGECKTGYKTCINHTWTECQGNVAPTQEICNDGKDNDCDGTVDEEYEIVGGKKVVGCKCKNGDKKICGSNIGICKTGYQICRNGAWGPCEGNIPASTEICGDKKDNDCDGTVDESDCVPSAKCTNGIKDPEEEGIDCGTFCNKPCPDVTLWYVVSGIGAVMLMGAMVFLFKGK